MTDTHSFTFPLKPLVRGVRRALVLLFGVVGAMEAYAQVSIDTAKQDPKAASQTSKPSVNQSITPNKTVPKPQLPNEQASSLPYCSDMDMAELKKQALGTTVAQSDILRGVMNDIITLKGKSCIVRDEMRLQGDQIEYVYSSEDVTSTGNAVLRNKNGDLVKGDKIKFNLSTETGRASSAQYSIASTNGRGTAESLDVLSSRRALMREAYYTTCVGENPDWYLKSKAMLIDRDKDIGEGISSVLMFKKVPILATPYIQFPLGNARRSGFLVPSLGVSTSAGVDLTVPYYLNLAPNYDLTLYPGVMTDRGPKLGAEYRYQTKKYGAGSLYGNYVLNDKKYNGEDRYYWRTTHVITGQLGRGQWTTSIDAQKASDNNYIDDIKTQSLDSAERILSSEYALQYNLGRWQAKVRYKANQTLQTASNTVGVPYDFKPQITLTGSERWGSLVASVDVESTRFTHPNKVSNAQGWRHVAYPSLRYEMRRAGWFITPKVGVYTTKYDLSYIPNNNYDKTASRVLPIMSLDSGLIFERGGLKWLGQSAIQTLEPRIYYLRVPYKDQSKIWNFDSALADFDISRIYGENIFTGRDRISEANQITAGVTSRVLSESTGEELFQATVAQRHYFADQRVTLPNGQINTQRKSDLLISASGRVAKNIWVDTSSQYKFETSQLIRTDTNIRWQPDVRKVFNAGYRRNKTLDVPTHTVYASAQWPVKWVSPYVYGVARLEYDLQAHKLSEALVGWEYAKDCWGWSAVIKRSVNGNGRYDNSYYMLLELKGFAGLGNNPTEVLNDNITGYQPARFIEDEPKKREPNRNER